MTSISLGNEKQFYLSCDFDKNLLFFENKEKALMSLLVSYNLKE